MKRCVIFTASERTHAWKRTYIQQKLSSLLCAVVSELTVYWNYPMPLFGSDFMALGP